MEKRIRKALIMLGAALGAVFAGADASIAYLSCTKETVNELKPVGPNGLDGILTEPHWNPDNGLLALPGESIAKDPQVRNTSQIDMDGLTALKVEFIYGEACPDREKIGNALSLQDMAYVCDVYRIDWNADSQQDWVRFEEDSPSDQTQRFYYKDVLKRNLPSQGDTTVPLFTRLSIPKEVDSQRYSHIQDMGGFDIRITGTILQQMEGETLHGLDSSEDAYHAGLFTFSDSL